ncbi:ImmA/IrrE family metallo-endopeptidase [Corallococcus sp. M34]|uniref:ImmA/IrrE family metallo-endopeptidase n=1 Tax=Citreicoccus inhibens TaxID=2849499 RepID=UPI001C23E19C|nr:ImmA/IrrE family metallo-endopeptidase [Citreicoccus inhibens]MBU8897914.1 ImmA/IrrE family metallo-endopeptidase [Citreicoccus inhibens]
MSESWLKQAVAVSGLIPPKTFPRDLMLEAPHVLPITFVGLRGLTVAGIEQWLARRGLNCPVGSTSRKVHGLMVSHRGAGILFHDLDDAEDERRFTVAHELAHFVLEQRLPRARAARRFGPGIHAVLDDQRPPTPAESVSAMIDHTPLSPQLDLLERGAQGEILQGHIRKAERRADQLAFELLAPANRALDVVNGTSADEGVAKLTQTFGLPREAAERYACLLRPSLHAPRFSMAEFLNGTEDDHDRP